MKIETIKTDSLVPYAKNAKRHDEIQIGKIAGSIKEFGFNNPVLIDKDNGIIAGHGRVLAAQKLGLTEVPCIRLGHLTDAQRRAYILADNRLAEIGGGWDLEMLKLELEELDIPLEDIGFGAEDLEELEITLGEPAGDPNADADAQVDRAAELAEKWGVETGQLWQLGDHRILCGDSTKAEDVERALGGETSRSIARWCWTVCGTFLSRFLKMGVPVTQMEQSTNCPADFHFRTCATIASYAPDEMAFANLLSVSSCSAVRFPFMRTVGDTAFDFLAGLDAVERSRTFIFFIVEYTPAFQVKQLSAIRRCWRGRRR